MPKLIVKSGYTTSVEHFINGLEYAGSKIETQEIHYIDGTSLLFDDCKKIKLEDFNRENIVGIRLTFKDGGARTVSPETYDAKIKSNTSVTVERVIEQIPDKSAAEDKMPHELQELDFLKYLVYIGERPGVEKAEGCGLFSLSGDILASDATQLVRDDVFTRGWMHIISMSKEDALRLGYDKRAAWRDLAISKAPEIAKAYNISLENLRFYGGFHANTNNPHVHINFYSINPAEAYVIDLEKASKRVKSLFTNAIFRDDVSEIKQTISIKRDEMVDALNVALERTDISKAYQDKLFAIADALPDKGKAQYQFMPPHTKALVKELLSDILHDEAMQPLYRGYLDAYEEYARVYADKPDIISQERFNAHNRLIGAQDSNAWRKLHNIIVKSAYELKDASAELNEAFSEDVTPQLKALQKELRESISSKILDNPAFVADIKALYEQQLVDNDISLASVYKHLFDTESAAYLLEVDYIAALHDTAAKNVPADILSEVNAHIDMCQTQQSISLPYFYLLSKTISAYPDTIAQAILHNNDYAVKLRDEIKKLVLRELSIPSFKREASELYKLMYRLNHGESDIQQALIGKLLQIPEIASAAQELWDNFTNSYEKINKEKPTRELFEKNAFYDEYSGVAATNTFLASIMDEVFASASARRIQEISLNMLRGIAAAIGSNAERSPDETECALTAHGALTKHKSALGKKSTRRKMNINW